MNWSMIREQTGRWFALAPLLRRVVCLVFALVAAPPAGRAQSVFTPQMTQALRKEVHLSPGATTLDEAVRQMTAQTGISIECADYLKEHRLSLHIEQGAALDVLNQIAAVLNARWTEAGAKHILLARARAVAPDDPLQIPAALKAVLPADLMRYLGYDVPEGLWLTPGEVKQRERQFAGLPKYIIRDTHTVLSSNITQRLYKLLDDVGVKIWDDVSSSLRPGQKLPYPQCAASTQQQIRLYLAARALKSMAKASTNTVLNESFSAYIRNPDLIVLEIQRAPMGKGEGMLMMGAYQAFGIDGMSYTGGGVGLGFFKDIMPKFDTTNKDPFGGLLPPLGSLPGGSPP